LNLPLDHTGNVTPATRPDHGRLFADRAEGENYPESESARSLPVLNRRNPCLQRYLKDYFATGNFIITGEYSGFCVIAGVATTHRFLQHVQEASRVGL